MQPFDLVRPTSRTVRNWALYPFHANKHLLRVKFNQIINTRQDDKVGVRDQNALLAFGGHRIDDHCKDGEKVETFHWGHPPPQWWTWAMSGSFPTEQPHPTWKPASHSSMLILTWDKSEGSCQGMLVQTIRFYLTPTSQSRKGCDCTHRTHTVSYAVISPVMQQKHPIPSLSNWLLVSYLGL